jgi:hypothetical protein
VARVEVEVERDELCEVDICMEYLMKKSVG